MSSVRLDGVHLVLIFESVAVVILQKVRLACITQQTVQQESTTHYLSFEWPHHGIQKLEPLCTAY